MIEKVVPLPEKHLAPTVVALQELHVSLRARIFVFENAELPSVRNLLVNLDRAEIEVLTHLYRYLGSLWNLISNVFVLYALFLNNDRLLRNGVGRLRSELFSVVKAYWSLLGLQKRL